MQQAPISIFGPKGRAEGDAATEVRACRENRHKGAVKIRLKDILMIPRWEGTRVAEINMKIRQGHSRATWNTCTTQVKPRPAAQIRLPPWGAKGWTVKIRALISLRRSTIATGQALHVRRIVIVCWQGPKTTCRVR